MPLWLRIAGSVLVCLLLVEGSFHAHGSGEQEDSFNEHGCFLCTFMSGAEDASHDADGDIGLASPPEQVIAMLSCVVDCPEPSAAHGNRSPPSW